MRGKSTGEFCSHSFYRDQEQKASTTTMQTRASADRKRHLDASTSTTPIKAAAMSAFELEDFSPAQLKDIFVCIMRVTNNDFGVFHLLSRV